ncbi:MAG TPA: hypothetical protein PKD12_03175 [Nitrospira sp.]|nr:hypothetical protein [Nitrospira sp.]
MGLKEEINNLISKERHRLKNHEQKMESYDSTQKSRFHTMSKFLVELTNAVPQEYIRKTFSDYAAIIEIGWNRPEDGTFEIKTRWNIEPSYRLNDDPEDEPPSLESAPGFDLQETSFLCYQVFESKKSFPDVNRLLEYLAKEIVKQVASFQRIKDRAKK